MNTSAIGKLLLFSALMGVTQSAHARTFILWAYGSGPQIQEALQGLSLFVQSSLFTSIVLFISLVGFFGYTSAGGLGYSRGGLGPAARYLITLFMFLAVFFQAKIDVSIEDPVNEFGGEAGFTPDVPLGLALPAVVTSELGRAATDAIEFYVSSVRGFPTGATMTGGNTFNFAAQMMADMSEVRIASPEINSSMRNYVEDCIIPKMYTGEMDYKRIVTSQDLWPELRTNDVVRLTTYTRLTVQPNLPGSVGEPSVVSCSAAWEGIKTDLETYAPSLMQKYGHSSWRYTAAAAELTENAISEVMLWARDGNGSAVSGTDVMNRAAVMNTFNDNREKVASAIDGNLATVVAAEKALLAQEKAWAISARNFNATAGYLFSVLQAFLYAATPLVVLFSLIPGMGGQILVSFVQFLAALALWQPLLAIVNFLITSYVKTDLQPMLQGAGVTLNTLPAISSSGAKLVGVGSYLGTMVPVIAWGLVKTGSLVTTNMFSEGAGGGTAAKGGDEAASDNMSIGNKSVGSESYNAKKYNWNTETSSGSFSGAAAGSAQIATDIGTNSKYGGNQVAGTNTIDTVLAASTANENAIQGAAGVVNATASGAVAQRASGSEFATTNAAAAASSREGSTGEVGSRALNSGDGTTATAGIGSDDSTNRVQSEAGKASIDLARAIRNTLDNFVGTGGGGGGGGGGGSAAVGGGGGKFPAAGKAAAAAALAGAAPATATAGGSGTGGSGDGGGAPAGTTPLAGKGSGSLKGFGKKAMSIAGGAGAAAGKIIDGALGATGLTMDAETKQQVAEKIGNSLQANQSLSTNEVMGILKSAGFKDSYSETATQGTQAKTGTSASKGVQASDSTTDSKSIQASAAQKSADGYTQSMRVTQTANRDGSSFAARVNARNAASGQDYKLAENIFGTGGYGDMVFGKRDGGLRTQERFDAAMERGRASDEARRENLEGANAAVPAPMASKLDDAQADADNRAKARRAEIEATQDGIQDRTSKIRRPDAGVMTEATDLRNAMAGAATDQASQSKLSNMQIAADSAVAKGGSENVSDGILAFGAEQVGPGGPDTKRIAAKNADGSFQLPAGAAKEAEVAGGTFTPERVLPLGESAGIVQGTATINGESVPAYVTSVSDGAGTRMALAPVNGGSGLTQAQREFFETNGGVLDSLEERKQAGRGAFRTPVSKDEVPDKG